MEDLRRAIAALFRRRGASTMSDRDFVLAASMDLRWFPPKDAQRMLEAALRKGLLVADAGVLRPTFDLASIEVPLDFAPSPSAFEAPAPPPQDVFATVVARIVAATGAETKAVVAEANRVQERMGIDLEAAALLAARRHDVAIDDLLGPVATDPPHRVASPRASRGRPA